jgi:hypothetical protein
MRAGAGELQEIVGCRTDVGDLGLCGAAAAHGDDDEVVIVREQARDIAGDCRLPEALAGADHRQRGHVEGLVLRDPQGEVRALVRDAPRKEPARELEALARTEDRLVGEIDGHLRLEPLERLVEVVGERDSVLVPAPQLLGAPNEECPDHVVRDLGQRVAHDRRVVLSVDQGQRTTQRIVTSPSIRAVYFSKARVSSENWMIRSWPWNGYLRQTSTCLPTTSTTL